MSGHADTIRRTLSVSTPNRWREESLAALDALLAENQKWKECYEELGAENQRYEAALNKINLDSHGTWESVVAGEALAGDEEPTEGYIIPEGDERCGYEIDACRCMRRKGHDGLHGCAHGDWGDRHARAPEDLIDDPAEALAGDTERDPDTSPFDTPSFETVEKGIDWIDRRVHGDDS